MITALLMMYLLMCVPFCLLGIAVSDLGTGLFGGALLALGPTLLLGLPIVLLFHGAYE